MQPEDRGAALRCRAPGSGPAVVLLLFVAALFVDPVASGEGRKTELVTEARSFPLCDGFLQASPKRIEFTNGRVSGSIHCGRLQNGRL